MNHREVLSSLPDVFLIRAGFPIDNPHPLAERLAEQSTLRDLIEAAGKAKTEQEGRRLANASSAFVMGLHSADLGNAVGDSFRKLASVGFENKADHLKLCQPIPVPNFMEFEFNHIEIDSTLKEVAENGEFQQASITLKNGNKAKLRTYGRLVGLSREAIINDDLDSIERFFLSIGALAANEENRQIFKALINNDTMADGQPIFHDDFGNTVNGSLGFASLSEAIGKLRNQPAEHKQPSNNNAAFLATSPDLELEGLKLAHESGLKVKVISSPYITQGQWFVMASPQAAPTIARLHLKGSDGMPVTVSPSGPKIQYDGKLYKVRADMAITHTSRIGIVRGL